jgi:DNA-binding GntR family transcriptional regulator
MIVYDVTESRLCQGKQPMRADPPNRDPPTLPRLVPLAARTLVEQVVDAIVEAAARGLFLPGDRIVEAEVARALNVSRIPVREALRILESQSVVVNTRFRGMRLMSVGNDRLQKTLKVRHALESLAGHEAMARLASDARLLDPMAAVLAEMHAAGSSADAFRLAALDTEFHRALCRASGNEALLNTWEPLSTQLTIIFGLATRRKPLEAIVAEHDELIAALTARDDAAFDEVLRRHILEYSREIEYEHLVDDLRKRAPAGKPA